MDPRLYHPGGVERGKGREKLHTWMLAATEKTEKLASNGKTTPSKLIATKNGGVSCKLMFGEGISHFTDGAETIFTETEQSAAPR